MVNKVMIIGRVGQTPQVRTVGENKVANFTVATTEKYKDREDTEWHNIAVWGKLADVVEKWVDKGMMVYIEGKIKTEKYTKDGQDKFVVRIMASSLQMLSKKEDSAPAAKPSQPSYQNNYGTTPIPGAGEPEDDSDFPF